MQNARLVGEYGLNFPTLRKIRQGEHVEGPTREVYMRAMLRALRERERHGTEERKARIRECFVTILMMEHDVDG